MAAEAAASDSASDRMTSPPELPVAPLAVLRRRHSAKWRTHPDPVIPLTVAEMDFELAEPVRDALTQAIAAGDTGYAMPVPLLGESFAGFAATRWRWEVDAAQVTAITDVGVGVVEVLRLATRPGDTVVFSPPVYPPFFDWVREVGARAFEVPLVQQDGGGWRLDLPGLERAFAGERPGAYVLCNPHNPVGRVHDVAELAQLIDIASRYGVLVISDEIHGPLVLPGAEFTPVLTVPGAAEHAVALVSASKAFNLAGLKCAAIVTASPTTRDLIDRLPPDARWRTGHLGVLATVVAYRDGGPWLDSLLATLDLRRAQLARLLAERLPTIGWRPPQATYLAWLDCQAIGPGSVAREHFLAHAGVALEPGPRFGDPGAGFARLNFATSADVLTEAIGRMSASLTDGSAR
jgi:cystathionine beta-lyase